VIFYRRHKPNAQVVAAYGLTNFSMAAVSARTKYDMAKSRWEIENPGFHDAKSRYDFQPSGSTTPTPCCCAGCLSVLALTIERLYRLRYLHRGSHRVRTAAPFCLALWLSLSEPPVFESSQRPALPLAGLPLARLLDPSPNPPPPLPASAAQPCAENSPASPPHPSNPLRPSANPFRVSCPALLPKRLHDRSARSARRGFLLGCQLS